LNVVTISMRMGSVAVMSQQSTIMEAGSRSRSNVRPGVRNDGGRRPGAVDMFTRNPYGTAMEWVTQSAKATASETLENRLCRMNLGKGKDDWN